MFCCITQFFATYGLEGVSFSTQVGRPIRNIRNNLLG